MTWLMTGLNYIGIRRAANFQLVFTWLKVLLVLVIAITCFASAHGLAANFGTVFTGCGGRLRRIHGRADRGALGL